MVECPKGHKEKDGKCVKKKGLFSGGKNSYNPFKMWGSWVGAVVGLFLWYMSFHLSPNNSLSIFIRNLGGSLNMASSILIFFVLPVLGFLVGWGIQSLWRKFRK